MEKNRKIIILGAVGIGVDILDAIYECNAAGQTPPYECVGWLDDDRALWSKKVGGLEVLGPLDAASRFADASFINAIGNPKNFWRRDAIIAQTALPPERFATVVHPAASVSRSARLGHGTVVLQNVSIASNAVIGNHVTVMANAVVSHDVKIGDYTCVTAGACISGYAKIGRLSYLGSNCSVIGYISVGDMCLVGMGSAILADVPENSVMVGNPAKFQRPTCE